MNSDELFGGSPYLEDQIVYGGDIQFKTSDVAKGIAICCLVVLIIYLIYCIYRNLRYKGEDYNQRQTHYYFNNLHGDTYDAEAKNAIAYGEAIENPRAIDHYRIGTAYLVNANNPRQAHRHFLNALNQVIEGHVDIREAPFILDRIDDYKDFFVDFPEIEELPIQQALLAHYEAKDNIINNAKTNKQELKEDDPDFTQKVILSRQDWQSDGQNVHDEAIYKSLVQQVNKVIDENARVSGLQNKSYSDVSNWLKTRYADDPIKKEKIDKVLSFLDNDYPVSSLPGISERNVLVNVWKRAYDPENKQNFNEIREAIGDAVMDCVEGNNVVCMSGRTSKIWQALAKLDKDPEIGVLKSKQAVRNEIYERSAKIVDDYVGTNGTASEALKEAYRKGEDTEQVREIMECMKQKVGELETEYKGMLPDVQLTSIITECQSVV